MRFVCLSQNQALELSWAHGSPVFLSWTQNRNSSSLDSHQVELCRQLGEKLGLKDGEQVLYGSTVRNWFCTLVYSVPQ